MFVFRNGRFVYLAPEHKDNGGTDSTESTQTPAPAAEPQNTDTGSGTEHMIPKSRFDAVNNELKALRDEQAKAQKEREETDRKAAEQQGQYQKLYEQATVKLGELTPKSQMADKLAELVSAQLKAEVDKWPEEVKALLPETPTDVVAFYEAVNRARPLAAKLTEAATPPTAPTGNGKSPKPAAPAGTSQANDDARKAQERFIQRQF